jgi:type IV pilus assembly protein PilV
MYINPNKQSGFSLIEVMVAALILSTAILGMAGLQMMGMKGTQQSFMKSQAMNIAYNMIELMRANSDGVLASNYVFTSSGIACSTALPACTSNCSPADVALADKINIVCGYKSSGFPATGG